METETDVQAMKTPEAGPTLLSPQTLAGQSGSASKAAGIMRAASALFNYLERGEGITRVELRQAMTEAFGGRTDAEGAWWVFRRKWNTESGGSGTSIPEEVEQRIREVEHGIRRKWNIDSGGSGTSVPEVVNARR